MASGKIQQFAKIQQEKGKKLVIPLAKEVALRNWQTQERDPYHVHPSEMAKKDWCHRGTYYRILTGQWPEETFNFILQSIFDEGHQIHDKWQQWLRGSGKLWGLWECEMCHDSAYCTSGELDTYVTEQRQHVADDWGDMGPGPAVYCPLGYGEPLSHMWKYLEVPLVHGIISGHEDAAVDDRLVEFKSVGIGTLRNDSPELLAKFYNKAAKLYDLEGVWKAMQVPLKAHVRQANVYLWLAKQMGLPYDKASIVYEYKPNQQSREYVIPMSMDVLEPLLEKVEDIEYALNVGKPPPCPYRGCKQCKGYEDTESGGIRDEGGVGRDPASSARAGAAGSPQAGLGNADPTPRRNRSGRQCPDDAVPATDGLAEVPGHAGSAGRGRRAILVKKTRKD